MFEHDLEGYSNNVVMRDTVVLYDINLFRGELGNHFTHFTCDLRS